VLNAILKRGALLPIAPVVCRLTMRAIAVWFKDTPVGRPRQCADFVGQWREELLASIWKRLPKVATEMALHGLAYNLTRVMNIVGVKPLMASIRA
jgi:hypothetical protein